MNNDPNLAPQNQPNDVPADQLDPTPVRSTDPLLDSPGAEDSLTTADVPVVTAPTTEVKKTKSKKKLAIIISSIVVGVLLLLGGGSALAYTLWYQNPDKVIGDALFNLATSESLSAKAALSGETDGTVVDLTADGRFTSDGAQATIAGSVGTAGSQVEVSGELISLSGADLYFKLDNTEETVNQFAAAAETQIDLSSLSSFFSGLDGQWIRVSADDLGQLDEDAATAQECLGTLETKIREDRSLLDEVGEIYRSNTFIAVDESLGNQSIEGVDSLGYRVSVNVDSYNTFIGAFEATKLFNEIKACDDSFDLSDARLEADDFADTTIEVWVSQWSHELTQLSLTSTDVEAPATLKLNTSFEQVDAVTAPAESKTIQEVYEEFMTAIMAA